MLPYNHQSGHRSGGRLLAPPPAKVKVIVTTFVEVDSCQFKSLVQCLTGKESVVAEAVEAPVSWTGNYIDHEVHAAGERKRRREVAGYGGASVAEEEEVEVEMMPAAALDELMKWLGD